MNFMAVMEVDKPKTKKAVEDYLKNYRQLKKRLGIEKAYGRESDDREQVEEYIGRVEQAIEMLEDIQRELIEERYINHGGGTFDYIVQDKIMVAERTYYRIKSEAINNIAYGLQITVYKEDK